MAKRTIYRDTVTGRFAKKSTWKRSKSRGGTRYVRQKLAFAVRPHVAKRPAPLLGIKTFFVTLKYTNERGTRQFDFIVRARNCADAYKFILKYAKTNKKLAFSEDDPRAKDVLTYLGSFGWAEKRCAEYEGAEYDQQPEGFVWYQ